MPVRYLISSTLLPSSIDFWNATRSAPAEKNRPSPVMTIALHPICSKITSLILGINSLLKDWVAEPPVNWITVTPSFWLTFIESQLHIDVLYLGIEIEGVLRLLDSNTRFLPTREGGLRESYRILIDTDHTRLNISCKAMSTR